MHESGSVDAKYLCEFYLKDKVTFYLTWKLFFSVGCHSEALHLLPFGLLTTLFPYVCLNCRACASSCDSKCARGNVGVNVLTWLSCCAAPKSGGRVVQVLECEVPIELRKWELSREMGIAPCWFVTFAVLFGAFRVCIHHSIKMSVCGRCMCAPVVILRDRERLFSLCVSVLAYVC